MQKKISFSILLLFFVSVPILGQTGKPESAHNILMSAINEAQSSKKNVLLIFQATWCMWCKRLEAMLENPEVKPIIDKNYIIARLDVMERGEKIQTHENSGGKEILARFGGSESGLPFIVFLDKKGKMIANSNVMPKKQNIGYPGSAEEITAFVQLLKQTAPRMISKEREIIFKYLKNNAPQ